MLSVRMRRFFAHKPVRGPRPPARTERRRGARRHASWWVALTALAVMAASPVVAAKPRGKFDTSEGFVDPRQPPLPRTHRFRLSVESGHIGLTSVQDPSTGLPVRFHFAPLMLGLAYQAQFLKVVSARIGANLGYNVANSRNAMPIVVNPRAWLGVQGRRVGVHGGYGFLLIFPTTIDGVGGRSDLEQPVLQAPHQVGGELSYTSRVDKVAFTASVGGQVVFTRICHLSLDCRVDPVGTKRTFPMFTVGIGVFFDGSIRRAKALARARAAENSPR